MIVDQLFNHKLIKEGEVYDLGREYGAPPPEKKKRSQDPDDHNPYPYSPEEDEDYFREIFRKKRLAAAKAKEHGVSESRRNKQRRLDEAWLMEDPVYRNFKRIGQYIAERKLTEPEILKIFADAEAGMTDKATGANRTFLGRGKDTAADFAGGVANALKGVWADIQGNSLVGGVDVYYDKATDALANLTGGQKGQVMQAIKKYRMLAKQYPKTAGLAKGALMAIAGLATGGAGLPAAAAFVYGLDSAIKGDKFSDIVRNASVSAATAWAATKIAGMFGGGDQAASGGMGDPSQLPPFDDAGNLAPGFHISPENGMQPYYTGELAPTPADIAAGYGPGGAGAGADSVAGLADTGAAGFGGGTYTTMPGDQGGFIAQAQGVKFQDLKDLNPQITNWDKLPQGTELQLPPSGPNTGSVWQGYTGDNAGMSQATADALSGRADNLAGMTQQAGATSGAAAVPTPSPLTFDPVTNSGTVTLPSGETVKAAVFPVDGPFQPRVPIGAEKIVIPYNGQEVTGYVYNGTAYFTKFPADAAASGTTSGAGTLSGVTAQQIAASPVYQQVYAQEIAKYGAEPSARAIQTAQQVATLKAKAAMAGAVRESVKLRILPVDKLIDQKLTTLSWALNESVGKPQGRSMHLTPLGVNTVFENIQRIAEAVAGPGREELPDLYRPDMSGAPNPTEPPKNQSWFGRGLDALDRGVKKVGGALSNFGHQLTTNVTKEKLKMNWHQAGKPSDSDQLAAWLVKQGVPIGVVNGIYSKMGLPVSAEPTTPTDPAKAEPQAQTGGAQRLMPFNNINPKTGQRWTVDDLEARRAERNAQATAATDTTATNNAPAPTATANKPTAGGPATFNAGNVFNMPGMEKYSKSTAPAKTPNFAGPGGYGKTTMTVKPMTGVPGMKTTPAPATAPAGTRVTAGGPTPDEKAKLAQRIAQATAKPVAEMLQMVETKEDVAKIKQFVDETFVKYGAVNESAFALRNQILEHVTQVGAQRRREHSRKAAH